MKVLLVGSSFAAVPILKILKSKGLKVHVCGSRLNEPCVKLADVHYDCDYTNHNALADIVQREQFIAAVPDCNDKAYEACAYLAELFGFKGYDSLCTTEIIINKAKFRNLLSDLGIPSPRYSSIPQECMDINLELSYPILIKPTNSFSGRGIVKVKNPEEAAVVIKACKKTSQDSSFLAEEFVDGQLFSHSTFIRNGKLVKNNYVEEYCTVYPYQVNLSNLAINIPLEIRKKIECDVGRIASKLKLVDGIFHTQFIMNNNYEYFFIESTRRCPGDLYYKLIEISSSYNYINNFLEPFLPELVRYKKQEEFLERPILRYTVSSTKSLVFEKIIFDFKSYRFDFVPLKSSGEYVENAPNGRFGIVFLDLENWDELKIVRSSIHRFLHIASLD